MEKQALDLPPRSPKDLTQSSPTWRPILEGPAAESASEAVKAITSSLSGALPSVDATPSQLLAHHASLESGRSGLALFYASLARSTGERSAADLAATLLGLALDVAPVVGCRPSLYSGAAGVGWAAAHLHRIGLGVGQSQFEAGCAWADREITEELERIAATNQHANYDLLYGLVGLGVYALERLPAPPAVALLTRIVERLRDQAERQPDGITWWTPPIHTRAPYGWYNLGMAHGVPGIIGFLGLLCAADVATATAYPLLDGAVSWLLAQRLPDQTGAQFPRYLIDTALPSPSRLAWCYGDPGVAAALFVAARAVNQPAWERYAISLALSASRQRVVDSGVVDAPICHGAIGLAHIFNRMYQATGEKQLAQAARFWLERGLAMRQPGGPLGGFHGLVSDADSSTPRRVAFRGILYGAAGIGLALLAATSDVEPTWDRILLLS